MTYERPEIRDFGNIAKHTYQSEDDSFFDVSFDVCFPGQSPCVVDG